MWLASCDGSGRRLMNRHVIQISKFTRPFSTPESSNFRNARQAQIRTAAPGGHARRTLLDCRCSGLRLCLYHVTLSFVQGPILLLRMGIPKSKVRPEVSTRTRNTIIRGTLGFQGRGDGATSWSTVISGGSVTLVASGRVSLCLYALLAGRIILRRSIR